MSGEKLVSKSIQMTDTEWQKLKAIACTEHRSVANVARKMILQNPVMQDSPD